MRRRRLEIRTPRRAAFQGWHDGAGKERMNFVARLTDEIDDDVLIVSLERLPLDVAPALAAGAVGLERATESIAAFLTRRLEGNGLRAVPVSRLEGLRSVRRVFVIPKSVRLALRELLDRIALVDAEEGATHDRRVKPS